jgi:acetyl-CoA carboxylase carboxyl transferase subunit alpha
MARLRVPILCTVIGEGGSGGALAICVGDVLLMLQYATYSVISPEGCASILWKSPERAPEAADKLAITATRLKAMGLIDKIVPEPLGGAHRDPEAQMQSLRRVLVEARREVGKVSDENRLEARYQRLMAYGKFKDAPKR